MNPASFWTSAAQETFPHLTQTNRVLTIIRLLRKSAADTNKTTDIWCPSEGIQIQTTHPFLRISWRLFWQVCTLCTLIVPSVSLTDKMGIRIKIFYILVRLFNVHSYFYDKN